MEEEIKKSVDKFNDEYGHYHCTWVYEKGLREGMELARREMRKNASLVELMEMEIKQ